MSERFDRAAGPRESDRKQGRLMETARRTDSIPGLVAGAKFVRRLLPGDDQYGDALSTAGDELPQHLGRLVAERNSQQPSAVRELGLGALQAWQALSEAQRRGRGTVDLAILFTDLVAFSDWALEAGDPAALELLRQVGAVEKDAISDNGARWSSGLGMVRWRSSAVPNRACAPRSPASSASPSGAAAACPERERVPDRV